jgi:hypothetical protein
MGGGGVLTASEAKVDVRVLAKKLVVCTSCFTRNIFRTLSARACIQDPITVFKYLTDLDFHQIRYRYQ